MEQVETKWRDTEVDTFQISKIGTVHNTILFIPQGVEENQRIGRKITLTKIAGMIEWIRPPLVNASTLDANGESVRIIMYIDHQSHFPHAVSVDDLLRTDYYLSFYNMDQVSRFTIILDETVNLNYAGIGLDNQEAIHAAGINSYIEFSKVCDLEIIFAEGATNPTTSNNVGFMLISRNGTPDASLSFRVRYLDI